MQPQHLDPSNALGASPFFCESSLQSLYRQRELLTSTASNWKKTVDVTQSSQSSDSPYLDIQIANVFSLSDDCFDTFKKENGNTQGIPSEKSERCTTSISSDLHAVEDLIVETVVVKSEDCTDSDDPLGTQVWSVILNSGDDTASSDLHEVDLVPVVSVVVKSEESYQECTSNNDKPHCVGPPAGIKVELVDHDYACNRAPDRLSSLELQDRQVKYQRLRPESHSSTDLSCDTPGVLVRDESAPVTDSGRQSKSPDIVFIPGSPSSTDLPRDTPGAHVRDKSAPVTDSGRQSKPQDIVFIPGSPSSTDLPRDTPGAHVRDKSAPVTDSGRQSKSPDIVLIPDSHSSTDLPRDTPGAHVRDKSASVTDSGRQSKPQDIVLIPHSHSSTDLPRDTPGACVRDKSASVTDSGRQSKPPDIVIRTESNVPPDLACNSDTPGVQVRYIPAHVTDKDGQSKPIYVLLRPESFSSSDVSCEVPGSNVADKSSVMNNGRQIKPSVLILPKVTSDEVQPRDVSSSTPTRNLRNRKVLISPKVTSSSTSALNQRKRKADPVDMAARATRKFRKKTTGVQDEYSIEEGAVFPTSCGPSMSRKPPENQKQVTGRRFSKTKNYKTESRDEILETLSSAKRVDANTCMNPDLSPAEDMMEGQSSVHVERLGTEDLVKHHYNIEGLKTAEMVKGNTAVEGLNTEESVLEGVYEDHFNSDENDATVNTVIPLKNTTANISRSVKESESDAEPEKSNLSANEHENKISVALCKRSGNGKRIWDKKHSCVYCKKKYSKLARHLEQQHSNEIDVKTALAFDKSSKERKAVWRDIMNRGDFAHNSEVYKRRHGEIIPRKRSSVTDGAKYAQCDGCLGTFREKELWRHVKKCHKNESETTQLKKRHKSVIKGKSVGLGAEVLSEEELDVDVVVDDLHVEGGSDKENLVKNQSAIDGLNTVEVVNDLYVEEGLDEEDLVKDHSVVEGLNAVELAKGNCLVKELNAVELAKDRSDVEELNAVDLAKDNSVALGFDTVDSILDLLVEAGLEKEDLAKDHSVVEILNAVDMANDHSAVELLNAVDFVKDLSSEEGLFADKLFKGHSVTNGLATEVCPEDHFSSDHSKVGDSFGCNSACTKHVLEGHDFNSAHKNRDDKNVNQEAKLIYTAMSRSKDGKRINDKKHCCVFCKKMCTKLARHLEHAHPNETDVKTALALDKISKERKAVWKGIMDKGDLVHNSEVYQRQHGEIIPRRRFPVKDGRKYGHCDRCLGKVLQNDSWRPLTICNDQRSTTGKELNKEESVNVNTVAEGLGADLPAVDGLDPEHLLKHHSFEEGLDAEKTNESHTVINGLVTEICIEDQSNSDDSSDPGSYVNDKDHDKAYFLSEKKESDTLVIPLQNSTTNNNHPLVESKNDSSATCQNSDECNVMMESRSTNENRKKIYVAMSKRSKNGKTIYDKKHSCIYCKKRYTKIARHLEYVHSNEVDVKTALAFDKGSRERKAVWRDITDKGDFAHNSEVYKQQDGEIIPQKRSSVTDGTKYVQCDCCFRTYQRRYFWSHMKRSHPEVYKRLHGETIAHKHSFVTDGKKEVQCDSCLGAFLQNDLWRPVKICNKQNAKTSTELKSWHYALMKTNSSEVFIKKHSIVTEENAEKLVKVSTVAEGLGPDHPSDKGLESESSLQRHSAEEGLDAEKMDEGHTVLNGIVSDICNEDQLDNHGSIDTVACLNDNNHGKDNEKEENDSVVIPLQNSTTNNRHPLEESETDTNTTYQNRDEYVGMTDTCSANDVRKKIYVAISSRSKDGKRINDKKHSCIYCQRKYFKMARHLEHMHSDEVDVKTALSFEKGSAERKAVWRAITNKGDFAHNLEVYERQSGEIIPKRRSSVTDGTKYVQCQYCLGTYQGKDFWKHMKYSHSQMDRKNTKMKRRHQIASAALLPVLSEAGEHFRDIILNTLINDSVSLIARNDSDIVSYGQRMFQKCHNYTHRNMYIRQRLRELARFLSCIRDIEGTLVSIRDCIDGQKFPACVNAVNNVWTYSKDGTVLKTQRSANRLWNSLLKIAQHVSAEAATNGDHDLEERAKGFIEVNLEYCKSKVSPAAAQTSETQKYRKATIVPLIEDLKALTAHLTNKAEKLTEFIESSKATDLEWQEMCRVTLAQVVLFNGKRSVMAESLEVQQYVDGIQHGSSILGKFLPYLSPLETKLAEVLDRVDVQVRRRKRLVILLPDDLRRQLDLLVGNQPEAGEDTSSKFMFAIPGDAQVPVRFTDVLTNYAKECGLKEPELLTSPSLSSQVAVIGQMLSFREKESEVLADFLANDIQVGCKLDNLLQDTIKVAKIAKLLMERDNGDILPYTGKSLEEVNFNLDEPLEDGEGSDNDERDTGSSVTEVPSTTSNTAPGPTFGAEEASAGGPSRRVTRQLNEEEAKNAELLEDRACSDTEERDTGSSLTKVPSTTSSKAPGPTIGSEEASADEPSLRVTSQHNEEEAEISGKQHRKQPWRQRRRRISLRKHQKVP